MYRVLTVPVHYLPIFPKSLMYHNVKLKTRDVELDVSGRVVGLVLGTQYKYIFLFLSVTYKKNLENTSYFHVMSRLVAGIVSATTEAGGTL